MSYGKTMEAIIKDKELKAYEKGVRDMWEETRINCDKFDYKTFRNEEDNIIEQETCKYLQDKCIFENCPITQNRLIPQNNCYYAQKTIKGGEVMDGKIVRVPFEPEEAYYILEILSELVYMDFFCPNGETRTITSENRKNLDIMTDIILYLNSCPCKSCRDDTTFSAWLKIIRNQSKDNYTE
jgi:hypothetical protein